MKFASDRLLLRLKFAVIDWTHPVAIAQTFSEL